MRKKKSLTPEQEERAFWKSSFNFEQLEDIPEEVNHLNLKESSITDAELAYICKRMRRINMLDLHCTTITNEGIQHLTKLESLKELRLKENSEIDNGCMQFIKQLRDLVFLHLRATNVNVIGLKEITSLQNLHTVLISDDRSPGVIEAEMKVITKAMPDCFFSVNGQNWFPLQPWERLMQDQEKDDTIQPGL